MRTPADTIAAIATPPGEGALAVVRMSGPAALPIGQQFLSTPVGQRGPRLEPRHAHLCQVLDADGAPFDQAVVVWYPAPRSYTGEDVLELTVHGGVMSSRLVLERCLRHGARAAEPGEFTLRAFLSGRLDLAQAEAVIDTVQAQTRAGLRLAHRQLAGATSEQVQPIRAEALRALALVEAAVDFPEDVEEPDRVALAGDLEEVARAAETLAGEFRAGKIYREGIRLVILGRPNVGKSSLLNALLREERAIVTPIPGTTRDIVEDSLSIGGVPVRALDTAGLRRTEDPVERIGVERALQSIRSADLCLLVLDRSEALSEEDWDAVEQTRDIRTVIVLNKCDLAGRWNGRMDEDGVHLDGRSFLIDTWPFAPALVEAAAARGEGIDRVEQGILAAIFDGRIIPADSLHAGGIRQALALERAAESLVHAAETARSELPLDLISVDLHGALQSLGEIIGETATDDLLHEIFSRFCIGK